MHSEASFEAIHLAVLVRIDAGASDLAIADALVSDQSVQALIRCEYAKCIKKLRLQSGDPEEGLGCVYEYFLTKVRWRKYVNLGPVKFRGYLARLAKCAILRHLRALLRQRRVSNEMLEAALRRARSSPSPMARLEILDELLAFASQAPGRIRQFMILMLLTGSVEEAARTMRIGPNSAARYRRLAWEHFKRWRRLGD